MAKSCALLLMVNNNVKYVNQYSLLLTIPGLPSIIVNSNIHSTQYALLLTVNIVTQRANDIK